MNPITKSLNNRIILEINEKIRDILEIQALIMKKLEIIQHEYDMLKENLKYEEEKQEKSIPREM